MSILVVAENNDGNLSEQTARLVTAAQQLGGDIDVLVFGAPASRSAEAAAALTGVRGVLVAESTALEGLLAEPVTDVLLSLADRYETFVAAASATGKNIMPRLAALLDVMPVSDVIGIQSPRTFRRPIYAGNAVQVVESSDPKIILTIRPSSFAPASTGGAAPITAVAIRPFSALSRFVENRIVVSERPELHSAKVVVSGGRALGSEQKFNELLGPIADRLGAALGASRAAVDAGFAPNDWQVGQTGKVVAPDIYFAVGISGAIQHVAGMKDAKVIVAINKDVEAPIFAIADYGLVGDLFTILPELHLALAAAERT